MQFQEKGHRGDCSRVARIGFVNHESHESARIVLAVLEWGLDHTETRSPQRASAGSWRLGFVVLELGFIGWIGSAGAENVAFGFILDIL
jgi:hypothetical protein